MSSGMSGTQPEIEDQDFSAQMEQLAAQAVGGPGAQSHLTAAGAEAPSFADASSGDVSGGQIVAEIDRKIAPLVKAVEYLGEASARHGQMLDSIEKLTKKIEPGQAGDARSGQGRENRGELVERMFSALHEELKTYKDEFLINVLQKPAVSGMIMLHDDLCEVSRQVQAIVDGSDEAARGGDTQKAVSYVAANLEHVIHHLIEVMSRIGVEMIELSAAKLDLKLQKVVSVEETATPEEDGRVAKRLRRGFMWRNRVFRPEEVVLKKCRGATAEVAGAAGKNE
jgi:molecular chaperone GrpE (heat shock protein)